MKTSAALRIAKGHLTTALGTPGVSHICCAVDDAYLKHQIDSNTRFKIKQHVHTLLGYCCNLNIWMSVHHGVRIIRSDEFRAYVEYFNKMQITRHA